jgi:hypothetical protein
VPDLTTTRPADAAPVATDWGQAIHDMLEGMQVGSVTVTVAAASNATNTITFPRTYATPPRVFLAIQSAGSNTQTHTWIATAGITTTGATVAAGRDDATTFSGSIVVAWLAIGTLA